MRQEQPTSDFNRSDGAILAGLFFFLGRCHGSGHALGLFNGAVVQKVQAHVIAAKNP